MAKEVKKKEAVVLSAEEAVKRINELNGVRKEVESIRGELSVHQKDLKTAEIVHGVSSKEYAHLKELVTVTESNLAEAEKKVSGLTMKRSELKPALDELSKKFEEVYRSVSMKEYHLELAEKDGDEEKNTKAKKVFKKLLGYLENDVKCTPKTAVALMLLVHNMNENKPWVQSKDFDGVIILKSNNIKSLYRFIMESLECTGFFEAKAFIEVWSHCGQAVSDALREIQKDETVSRETGADLNLVETEFENSEDDIPAEEKVLSTQEEVAPEVEE